MSLEQEQEQEQEKKMTTQELEEDDDDDDDDDDDEYAEYDEIERGLHGSRFRGCDTCWGFHLRYCTNYCVDDIKDCDDCDNIHFGARDNLTEERIQLVINYNEEVKKKQYDEFAKKLHESQFGVFGACDTCRDFHDRYCKSNSFEDCKTCSDIHFGIQERSEELQQVVINYNEELKKKKEYEAEKLRLYKLFGRK